MVATDSVERRLYRQMSRTCREHELLAEGDRIMVAVSGGKDSYGLLVLLHKLAARLPFPIELVAVHLDQVQPGYDGAPLLRWLEESGFAFEILREDTYTVVTDRLKEGATYCSLCSRLRRGILYTAAERLGCNKIALGHHRDDALETLLMNMFHAGKMQAMPARYTTDDGRFQVLRPLVECAEADLATFAEQQAFPILPCNLCGSQDGLERQAMKAMLDELEQRNPNVRAIMLNAIRNVRPTHLLDRDVLAAWHARPADVRPDAEPEPEPRPRHAVHAAAEPVRRRLPLIPGSRTGSA